MRFIHHPGGSRLNTSSTSTPSFFNLLNSRKYIPVAIAMTMSQTGVE